MPSSFLALPYDIRYLIYQEIFPRDEQLYIQALDKSLRSILPEGNLPTSIFRVDRQLHHEASEFLYNGYLFNIVGTKKNCLANYKPFLQTLRKHARNEVNMNAFSNGNHSATMCLSLQAGDAKMALINRRRRGEPKTILELQEEQDFLKAPARRGGKVTSVMAVAAVLVSLLSYILLACGW